ncbi:uncharacterized protein LOC111378407 [Olea europaea var. sylvestris]|uniref:uncharacterized protein LOC111378407 n=1 Tax=Olea europaea var. sylvestris TaxID=158386 RepID=UPI000C1D0D0D|nr:uncharacterized protein LOC111378407 [Olea europaea var. sylvestris]
MTHTLNTKFDTLKGGWVEELPSVMWSYHTTTRSSTRETPYSISSKVEAMIPLEIGIPSFYTSAYNKIENEKSLHKELDLVKEVRNGAELENAIINNAMQSITTRSLALQQAELRFHVLQHLDDSPIAGAIEALLSSKPN